MTRIACKLFGHVFYFRPLHKQFRCRCGEMRDQGNVFLSLDRQMEILTKAGDDDVDAATLFRSNMLFGKRDKVMPYRV